MIIRILIINKKNNKKLLNKLNKKLKNQKFKIISYKLKFGI